MQSKHLRYKQSLTLFPTPPFHFDGTFHKPSHFPDHLSLWEKGIYWQSFRVDRQLYGLKIYNQGTIEKPELEALLFADHIIGKQELELLKNEITWRFNLKADLKEFFEIAGKDKKFSPIFKKWRGIGKIIWCWARDCPDFAF
ncbi:hypothetical protein COS81_00855 [candidate division WWE3 bacterium CG06_land_8_20_14_3_00_42_16]|uniref:Uncharacterized protein n=1 Tax=candidate division WWE3 bacterium CG06_land_8_20_14_3_00_42_16 TaxID=1975083 RepID=A0A2M7APD8_UNCKA|nr:MAG: hypothetical protein AUJ38_01595 [bacterium CG1_02_42_9]PIU69236.1 MAG: hypothetical protein COS81_00855 [candidate division WWE3 bacterium CG06_land_8_20_14_3_00_42_16]